MNTQQTRDLATLDYRIRAAQNVKRAVKTATYGRIAAAVAALPGQSWVTPNIDSDQITFYVSWSQLKTFADPLIVGVHAALQDKSLRLSLEKFTETKDSFEQDYIYVTRVADVKIRVYVSAYESEETAACRRVLVGMEKVERPIYRYDCLEVIATEVPAPVLLDTL